MRPRGYYKMKPNHGREAPSQIIGIGVATKENARDGSKRLASVHVIAARRKGTKWYGYAEEAFTSGKDLWYWVRQRTRPNEPIYCFCYNWHEAAQVTGFWTELDKRRFVIGLPRRIVRRTDGTSRSVRAWAGICAIEKPFIVFACTPKGTLKLVDVQNYYDLEIEAIATSFGIDALATPARKRGTSGDVALLAEWRARVAFESMRRTIHVWRESNRGNWQPTAARLAMSNWRHEFMQDYGMIDDDPRMDREFHRQACFGGEIGCWFIGEIDGPIFKCDVNSLYPKVMYEGSYPNGLHCHCTPESIVGQTAPLYPHQCIATVRVRCDHDLPVRRSDNSVAYPRGCYVTTLAGSELAFAQENKRIESYHGWTWFKVAPIFRRYVEYWWKIRQQAKAVKDKAGDCLAKLCLNSLYGKFGARRALWVNTPELIAPYNWGHFLSPVEGETGFKKCRAIAGISQRQTKREERNDSFPAITAFVTADARMFMRNVRRMLPEMSCLAQQTDCLLLTEQGYQALFNSQYFGERTLGKFRTEAVFDKVRIWGPSRYQGDDLVKCAGLPLDRVRVGENRFVCELQEKTAEMVASGVVREAVEVRKVEYVLTKEKCWLEYGANGWAIN